MANYQPLPDSGHGSYSPPARPSRMAGAQSTELRNLDGYDERARSTSPSLRNATSYDGYEYSHDSYSNRPDIESKGLIAEPQYHQYKRRWFGLAELAFLNFAVGWGYAAPGVVATTAITWFDISYEELNSLSIASSLVFLVPAPFVIWILNRYGPKFSIIIACVLTVIGNWIVYAATRAHNFPGNIAGTIIAALASPFILAAPTRYSRQWFGDSGRTFATALPSLAYPLGAGLGAGTGPYMVKPKGPMNYDQQALIIAVVFTAAAIPAPFIPREPPTAPSAVAAAPRLSVKQSFKSLYHNPPFYLKFTTFALFAGTIDTMTSVTTQALDPYGISQTIAGLSLSVLIFVGVTCALIVSPILDRTKKHLLTLKILVCLIAAAFTALPFVPQTKSIPAIFVIYGIIGGTILSIEPCVLELQASWTHPVSPEFSSFICWSGAKVTGAIFTIIAGVQLPLDSAQAGQPKGSLFYGFIFLAAICWLGVPLTMLIGVWKFKRTAASKLEGT